MSEINKYYDLVGAYLDNELEGDHLDDFNKELTGNPDLKKELEYQHQLIEGIKANRRLELKSRLDNVTVGGPSTTGSVIKILSGAVIVAGIGFGIYNFILKEEDPQQEIYTTEADIFEEPKQEEEPVVIETGSDPVEEEPTQEETPASEGDKSVEFQPDQEVKSTEVIIPDVPEPIEDFATDNIDDEDLDVPSKNLGLTEAGAEPSLEVEIISNRRRFDFHYQVLEDRLILYGTFDEEPYQLLEINLNKEKQLYLYFKDRYYNLNRNANEITPLTEITNSSLIIELDKIKNKDP